MHAVPCVHDATNHAVRRAPILVDGDRAIECEAELTLVAEPKLWIRWGD